MTFLLIINLLYLKKCLQGHKKYFFYIQFMLDLQCKGGIHRLIPLCDSIEGVGGFSDGHSKTVFPELPFLKLTVQEYSRMNTIQSICKNTKKEVEN